jgi:hypothetical protein
MIDDAKVTIYGPLIIMLPLGVGVVLLFFPRRLQKVLLMDRWGPFRGPLSGSKFRRRHIQSTLYLWELRFGGVLALLFAAFMLYDWVVYH